MAYLLIQHRVEDFDRWKPYYDKHESVRLKAGIKELFLLRGLESPNEVTILFEANDIAKTRDFINSEDLKNTMQKAGVIGKPVFHLMEKAALRKKAA